MESKKRGVARDVRNSKLIKIATYILMTISLFLAFLIGFSVYRLSIPLATVEMPTSVPTNIYTDTLPHSTNNQATAYCGFASGYIVDVPKGAGLNTVLASLHKFKEKHKEGISYTHEIDYWIAKGAAKIFFNSSIKYGKYVLNTDISLFDFLKNLSQGNSIKYKFSIIPGMNLFEVMSAMNKSKIFSYTIHLSDFSDEFNLPTNKKIIKAKLEGRLLPDSYCIDGNANPRRFIRKAFEAMQRELDRITKQHSYNQYIMDENALLTLASIIEKETSLYSEKNLISAVYLNRLKIGMKLQADPTVIYGIGETFNGNITRKNLLQRTDYNTYTNRGLPPGPIAMPSVQSIESVFTPAKVPYLYFVAKGDGSRKHSFSTNYSTHKKYVEQYLLERKKRIMKK